MTGPQKLSVHEKLLLAAYYVEQEGTSPFTAEQLVVAAWQRFPRTFGLSGFCDEGGNPLHPDSNRVFAEIMGSKPIRKRGLLVKVGKKMYELTGTGRDQAARLARSLPTSGGSGELDAKVGLGRDNLAELRRLLDSRAVRKVDGGQGEALSFHDACLFWGITPQSTAIELQGRLGDTEGTVKMARRSLAGSTGRFHHGGDKISSETLSLIERTHGALKAKFEAEISTIMRRTDQRRR